MTDTNPFSIIEEAGLSQGEFAKLCNVTRCTVNLWVNGRMKPHRYLQTQVDSTIEKVRSAIESGTLPVHAPRRGPARMKAIHAALDAALA